jgi:hypothetical protein
MWPNLAERIPGAAMPAFPALLQVRGCWGTERAAICSAGSAARRHADGEGADHVSEVSGRQRRHACLAGARGAGRGSDACGGGDRGWARGAAPAGVDECGNTPAFGATMGRPMIADATGPTGGRHADSPCAEKRPRGCLVRTSVPRERPRRFAPSFTKAMRQCPWLPGGSGGGVTSPHAVMAARR